MTQVTVIRFESQEADKHLEFLFEQLVLLNAELIDLRVDRVGTHAYFNATVRLDSVKCTSLSNQLAAFGENCSADPGEAQSQLLSQRDANHVATVYGRAVSAKTLRDVLAVLSSQGLTVLGVKRLSRDLDGTTANKTCFEILLAGELEQEYDAVREKLRVLTTENAVDVAIQSNTPLRGTRKLVCFDMDSTLIQAEVIDELAKAAGVGDQVIAITEAAMAGELDFNQSFEKRLGLLNGLSEEVLQSIAENLPLTEGVEHLITTLKKLGCKTAILSGGFNYFGRFLQSKLGFDFVYANELEIEEGKVTGRAVGEVVNGDRKAALVQMLAEQEGLQLNQVVAVGDGANDLPMLGLAGMGVAFQAKPIVRAKAEFAISHLGLDALLYLMGYSDQEVSRLI